MNIIDEAMAMAEDPHGGTLSQQFVETDVRAAIEHAVRRCAEVVEHESGDESLYDGGMDLEGCFQHIKAAILRAAGLEGKHKRGEEIVARTGCGLAMTRSQAMASEAHEFKAVKVAFERTAPMRFDYNDAPAIAPCSLCSALIRVGDDTHHTAPDGRVLCARCMPPLECVKAQAERAIIGKPSENMHVGRVVHVAYDPLKLPELAGWKSEVVVDDPHAPAFKVGQWVRCAKGFCHIADGQLAKLVTQLDDLWLTNFGGQHSDGSPCTLRDDQIEPALPRAGEWWVWRSCGMHGQRANYADIPFKSLGEDDPARAQCHVACGCLAPVNFGRGEAK